MLREVLGAGSQGERGVSLGPKLQGTVLRYWTASPALPASSP